MNGIESYSDPATMRSRIEAAWSHLTEEQDSQQQEEENSSKRHLVEDSDEGQQTSSEDEAIDLACETPPPTPSEDDWTSTSEY